MQFSDLVKKYKPVAYVNGHDHVIDYSAPTGYKTQFFTSGASHPVTMEGSIDVNALIAPGWLAKVYSTVTDLFKSISRVTYAGAGSFTEPNDGGWNKTTGRFRTYKTALKYSNVRMSDGGSYTGNIIMTATPSTLRVRATCYHVPRT